MENYTSPMKVAGWPFMVKNARQRDGAIRFVAEQAEPKAPSEAETTESPHGHGDPASPYPGDRPEAYDTGMTADHFADHFTGTMDDLAAITFSDGTQIHGKLKVGFVPLKGWAVDEAGFVVQASRAAQR